MIKKKKKISKCNVNSLTFQRLSFKSPAFKFDVKILRERSEIQKFGLHQSY